VLAARLTARRESQLSQPAVKASSLDPVEALRNEQNSLAIPLSGFSEGSAERRRSVKALARISSY
jgi:hypothetical protein